MMGGCTVASSPKESKDESDGSSSAVDAEDDNDGLPREMKFVTAREPVIGTPTVEMTKVEKNKNVADQRVLNKPRKQSVVKSEARTKSHP